MAYIIVSPRLNERSRRRPPASERKNGIQLPERSTTGWESAGGLKMDLHWLAAQLSSLIEPARSDIANKVESILGSLDEAIESVRSVASELRPQVLVDLGLVAAIERQVEDFERRSGIRCRVDTRVSQVDVDPSRAAAIYMIIQEALTNVLQHAHATVRQ